MMKTKNPVTMGVTGFQNIKALGGAVDTKEPNASSLESLAAHRIANRFRLSIHHARTICELAGIGGAA
jgi:hypothetical protein